MSMKGERGGEEDASRRHSYFAFGSSPRLLLYTHTTFFPFVLLFLDSTCFFDFLYLSLFCSLRATLPDAPTDPTSHCCNMINDT